MAYLRFRADQLFDGYRMHGGDAVLIMTEQGRVEAIVPVADAGEEIAVYPGILSPGLINCHCHLELSHLRDRIPQKEGLVSFVSRIMRERHLAADVIAEAIGQAEEEMVRNGIVAVGDICNNADTLSQKSGGKLRYHNFIEVSGFNPAVAEERFRQAEALYSLYMDGGAGPASIVPHAPYSVSGELWEKIVHFPGNRLLTIHNQESLPETELFRRGSGEFLRLYQHMGLDISFFAPSGKSSLQTYLPRFRPQQSLILVHNVYTTGEDVLFAMNAGHRIGWCLCPNANLYITEQLPDVPMLMQQEQPIVLGTDSLASNTGLSILAEMRTIRQHFPAVTDEQLFGWATLNGARALQMDAELGSFEAGKQPGLVLSSADLATAKRLV